MFISFITKWMLDMTRFVIAIGKEASYETGFLTGQGTLTNVFMGYVITQTITIFFFPLVKCKQKCMVSC